MKVKSFVHGEWFESKKSGRVLAHAVSGEELYEVSSEGIDFRSVLHYGRSTGGPALRGLSFHQRASLIKAIALYLHKNKEKLYEVSKITGATRSDSWIDIEGGIGTLFTYASKARKELPDEPFYVDGKLERTSKNGSFVGHHICVPLEGVAVHINAYNFPCWGMLEKMAPSILAGVPVLIKPGSATCYLTEAVVKEIIDANILPAGALQLICGSVGDLFEHLKCQDIVTFTGSQATGHKLKTHPKIISESIRFNLEADSLNSCILGLDGDVGTEVFDLFINEVAKEMTVKAGQKCTAIRRAIVPKHLEAAVLAELKKKLEAIAVGNPENADVQMGALAGRSQVEEVQEQVSSLKKAAEPMIGFSNNFRLVDADKDKGAFMAPTVLYCRDPFKHQAVHEIEAFGPVSTVMGYQTKDEAILLSRMGGGSLVSSICTADPRFARDVSLQTAAFHGRLLVLDPECAQESTGHGSPLPHLVHGGPGRAGGGEELGGIRSVLHFMQRTAIQGSPNRITSITNQWQRGADRPESSTHPFRKYFEELEIGDTYTTHRRTVSETDVVNFACLSGDHFYAHMDEIGAKESIFEKRVAHGYFVLAAAAGLFVHPAPGPVLANYGLEKLRFIEPVSIGDTIYAKLTCKEKAPKDGENHGVVHWNCEVLNQNEETVAVYTVLTLVKRKEETQ